MFTKWITALTGGNIKLALGLGVTKSPARIQRVCNPILVETTYNVPVDVTADTLSLVRVHFWCYWRTSRRKCTGGKDFKGTAAEIAKILTSFNRILQGN